MQYPGKAITNLYPTRALCGKRLQNNLPFASITNGHLHTCFEDTVLVPLASWLFLLALVGYIAYSIASSKQNNTTNHTKEAWHKLMYRKQAVNDPNLLQTSDKETEEGGSLQQVNGPSSSYANRTKWPKTKTFFSILYSLLVLATLLMNILEIVRLYLADRGAGLLPFSLGCLVIILLLMHIPLPQHLKAATGSVIVVFWFFSIIFTAVQISTLSSLMNVESRAGTEYLNSDQIVDTAVIIALYAVELIVDSYRVFKAFQTRR